MTHSEDESSYVLDLTNEEAAQPSENAVLGSNQENSIAIDDDELAFFVEAGVEDTNELAMLGIDLEEIKAQQQLSERFSASSIYSAQVAESSSTALRRQQQQQQQAVQQPLNSVASSPSLMGRLTSSINSFFQKRMLEGEFASTEEMRRGTKLRHEKRKREQEVDDARKRQMFNTIEAEAGSASVDLVARGSGSGSSSTLAMGVQADSSAVMTTTVPAAPVIDLTEEGQADVIYLSSDEEEVELSAPGPAFPFVNSVGIPPRFESQLGLDQYLLPEDFLASFDVHHADPFFIQDNDSDNDSLVLIDEDLPSGPYTSFGPRRRGNDDRDLRVLLENVQYDDPPAPEDRHGTPEGLSVNLLEHQKIGLQWMLKMENSTKMGGILADDMGLGKTIQAIAIIVENPSKHPDLITGKDYTNLGSDEKLRVKATLVVCPVSLMDQWKKEIEEKTCPVLKVMVYHGNQRTSLRTDFVDYDVIISSYAVVAGDFSEKIKGPVSKTVFHRVILDEAHCIKNRNTVAAKGCCEIDADHRWCLTATPIQNKIEELYSLIRFLKIKPFCDWTEFQGTILKPMRSGNHGKAIKVTSVLMKAISLRRSKKAMIDGRPILELPARNVHMTHIDFSPEERSHYRAVESRVQKTFSQYVRDQTVMSNYSSVLVLLLRLRQSCLHPHLTLKEAMADGPEGNLELELEVARSMESEVVTRLCNEIANVQQVDCPICLDVAQVAQILRDCGHVHCKECLDNYLSSLGGGTKRCPQCRGNIVPESIVSLKAFATVHAPHLLNEPKPDDKGKEKEEIDFVSSAKINKMLEILKETRKTSNNKDKTIVFSQFTSFLNLIDKPLTANGFKYLRYDGSVSVKQRAEVIRKFHNDPEYTVLLVSTKCGSLGLNLTCANRVIVMDVWWNPALENQAIDRVHRIGQTKPVDVHRIFINDTVEDRIIALQAMKQSIADGVLGEGEGNGHGRLGLNEMLYLFRGGDFDAGSAPAPALPTGWQL